jgi:hypothetical protein
MSIAVWMMRAASMPAGYTASVSDAPMSIATPITIPGLKPAESASASSVMSMQALLVLPTGPLTWRLPRVQDGSDGLSGPKVQRSRFRRDRGWRRHGRPSGDREER